MTGPARFTISDPEVAVDWQEHECITPEGWQSDAASCQITFDTKPLSIIKFKFI